MSTIPLEPRQEPRQEHTSPDLTEVVPRLALLEMSDGTPGFRSSSDEDVHHTTKRKRLRKKKERKGRKKESDCNQDERLKTEEMDENENKIQETSEKEKTESVIQKETREKVSSPSKRNSSRNSSRDKSMSGMRQRMNRQNSSERKLAGVLPYLRTISHCISNSEYWGPKRKSKKT